MYRIFLSTLSLRRATAFVIIANALVLHFYPRSPCGERPQDTTPIRQGLQFLSTLSLRRATPLADGAQPDAAISIHALLAESDGVVCGPRCARPAFLSTLSLRRATP